MRLYLSSYRMGNKPEELLKLLKGNTRTALIANYVDYRDPEEIHIRNQQELKDLTSHGLRPDIVDLKNYFGKSEELKDTLSAYDLIWVRGGNTFVLRRALAYSGADKIIRDLLDSDSIVYGGYSAGVCVLAPTLKGIDRVDDPSVVPNGYTKDIIWDGLNIIPYSVAPHYQSNHPESTQIENCVTYFKNNHMEFKTLRDGEVIIRDGDVEVLVS